MTPYHEQDGVTLYHGDCLQVLRTLPAESIDAVVSDPPYGLSFMGKRWDYDVPATEVWAECLRVLKPGGHLLAFAGTRTQHRMACRIEDAGFEIRDMIAWVYGSGFPKSHDVAKAVHANKTIGGSSPRNRRQAMMGSGYIPGETKGHINKERAMERLRSDAKPMSVDCLFPEAQRWQGWGTALKPALEPITVARKPLIGTVAETVLQHGTGALNVDGCRVGTQDNLNGGGYSGGTPKTMFSGLGRLQPTDFVQPSGRWPANLIHDGSDEVTGLFPETGAARQAEMRFGKSNTNCYGNYSEGISVRGHNDTGGSAARFFYCAKASKRDRGETNRHPTVKPTALMRYLCKLITPPGGLVLDPFTGSGSTGRGAVLEGFRFVGMELDAEHVEEAKRRILEVQNGWTDEPEDEPVEDLPGQRLLF